MGRTRTLSVAGLGALAALVAAATGAAVLASGADAAGKQVKLRAPLHGKHTVPGPGDPDGKGRVVLRIINKKKLRKRKVCYRLSVRGLGGVRALRISRGKPHTRGPTVLRVFRVSQPVTGEGTTKGCTKANRRVARKLRRNPSRFYAEVINAGYPQGALRGQLRKRNS